MPGSRTAGQHFDVLVECLRRELQAFDRGEIGEDRCAQILDRHAELIQELSETMVPCQRLSLRGPRVLWLFPAFDSRLQNGGHAIGG